MNQKFAELDREFAARVEKDVQHYATKIVKGHFRGVMKKAERICDQAFVDGIEIALLVGAGIKIDVALALYKQGTLPRLSGELMKAENSEQLALVLAELKRGQ